MSLPTFVYKILPSSSPPPVPIPDVLPPSDLDVKDGFIHLSTAKQIHGTLRFVFKYQTRVFVVKIGYEKLQKEIKWEKGTCVPGAAEATNGDMFPHLYNNLRLGKNEIESIAEWKSDSEGWESAVKRAEEDGWLIF